MILLIQFSNSSYQNVFNYVSCPACLVSINAEVSNFFVVYREETNCPYPQCRLKNTAALYIH